jgi:hypothetical protein
VRGGASNAHSLRSASAMKRTLLSLRFLEAPGMAADTTLYDVLRAADPAADLDPLPVEQRLALLGRVTSVVPRTQLPRSRRVLRVVLAVVAALALTSGIAWAAGALSPLGLFQSNPEHDGSAPGGLWDQHVVAGSVHDVGSVDVPHVGAVAFWYGRSSEGGWCAALRLPSGDWLGTGKAKLDGGGTVPGCFPTREAVNDAATPPVYVITGFDYVEDDVDTRSVDGTFWRIYYGRITAPGAARIADVVSARSTAVVDGNLFILAVPDPDPLNRNELHLVAYGSDGRIVADDCAHCRP